MLKSQTICVLLSAFSVIVQAQIGTINTYAGNDSGSLPGDGGPATSAVITNPAGIAADAAGNLYITASGNSLIRLVNAQSGIITTAAGGGTGGDGGPATSAQLTNPCDVKLDSSGNLYLSETCTVAVAGGGGGSGSGGIARIRRVDAATGLITTIAGGTSSGFAGDGGPATAALLSSPAGLAIDGSRNIFIADSGNNRIRRIDGASGIITTVAGNGLAAFSGDGGPAVSASLNAPFGVAVDPAGNLYIADSGNARVRRVDAITGAITTVAGTGATAFNGDGIAATTANLNFPASLAFNPSGNVVFTDVNGMRVRMIDNSGLIWTIAGDGYYGAGPIGDNGPASLAQLYRPEGIAILFSGPMYVAEFSGDRIRRVALPSSVAATAVTVSAGGTSFASGVPVTFAATLAASNGTPSNGTGSVMFFDGSNPIGGGPISNGTASMTTSSLALGPHNISAVYPGDSNYGGSYSPVLAVTILTGSSVAITSSLNPSVDGQQVTFTAMVTPGNATGTVQFLDGAAVLATVPLTSGSAAYSTSTLAPGTHSITAGYSGDSNYSGSQSAPLAQTVNSRTSTATALTSNTNPSFSGASVTFTATVNPAMATGNVQFMDGGTLLGTAALSSGSAYFSTSTLTVGTHSITAVYGGDAAYSGSTSPVLSQSVKLSAGMTTGLSPSPAVTGQTVTISANMNPAATGTVTFTDNGSTLAIVPVSSGSASYSTTNLTQGTHTLGVAYSGDATYMAVSTTIPETVLGATSVTLTSSVNPSTPGQSVSFTATVTPAAATGAVQFYDGGTLLGTAALANGTATLSTAALAQGSHSITANYGGDASYAPSYSSALIQNVKVTTSLELTSSKNPARTKDTVIFTTTVTPSAATGAVQFYDGSTLLATKTLSSGTASYSYVKPSVGTHTIQAVYGGNSSYAGSSATLSEVVQH